MDGVRRVSVRVPWERAEEARARMIELYPQGFEEVDHNGEVELAAYTGPGGEELLWEAFGPGAARDVAGGWEQAWRRFHRPARIGPLWIGPPWKSPDEGALAVVIDPGLAFGTGGHPTTRLCLELLVEQEAGSLVDLGCGSGVLAIAAARLGFAPVFALDADKHAVFAAGENAAANGVEIEVRPADIFQDAIPETDVAIANIDRGSDERVAARVRAGALITSGYLVSEFPSLPAWRATARREAQEWAADLFVPSQP